MSSSRRIVAALATLAVLVAAPATASAAKPSSSSTVPSTANVQVHVDKATKAVTRMRRYARLGDGTAVARQRGRQPRPGAGFGHPAGQHRRHRQHRAEHGDGHPRPSVRDGAVDRPAASAAVQGPLTQILNMVTLDRWHDRPGRADLRGRTGPRSKTTCRRRTAASRGSCRRAEHGHGADHGIVGSGSESLPGNIGGILAGLLGGLFGGGSAGATTPATGGIGGIGGIGGTGGIGGILNSVTA